MIHVLHGFLGSSQDFSFLAHRGNVICHDLYQTDFRSIEVKTDDVLIGYSMGGRLAMEIATQTGFNLRKLVLINAHPGLATEDDKKNREIFETNVLEQLATDSFMDFWNSLPIFSMDLPLAPIDAQKREASKTLFEDMRLSRQPNYLPVLAQHSLKVLYIAGLDDARYSSLAREVIAPTGIRCRGVKGGHRLFQQSAPLINVLSEEGIL